MIILGITGGIGSGKSTVCEILRLHHIPVYDADKEAKKLNDTSSVIRKELIAIFGETLYNDNKLNRRQLAAHIFNNKNNLQQVNKIIHTELAKHFKAWTANKKSHPVVAIDAAVLFEAGFQNYVDQTITVTAPREVRMERVMKRDQMSEEQIEARMASQMSEEEKINLSDFTITNDGNHSIIQQIELILKTIENSRKLV